VPDLHFFIHFHPQQHFESEIGYLWMENWRSCVKPLTRLSITQELLQAISEIDEFKGRWEALSNLAPERLSALKKTATIESVGSSTRIEGVKLSDDEVERLLSGLDIQSFRTRDEQEVAGYHAVMELIFASWPEITLTQNHIRQLHRDLLQYSNKDERHRGEYKKLPNHVEAYDPHGRSLGVIFETTTPFDTPSKMRELVDWTRHALETNTAHAILIIAVFVVRFLAIHPFQDGNGRLSRVLTTLQIPNQLILTIPTTSSSPLMTSWQWS
jgi:Fic family protein